MKGFVHRLRWLPRDLGYVHLPRLASRVRRWWVLARHPHADVRIHRTAYLGPGFSLYIPERGKFVAGPGAEFRRDFRAEVAGTGSVVIGQDAVFTYDVLIQCSTTVRIGERCVLAKGVVIVDGNHRFRDPDNPMLDQGFDFRPIRIDDDAAIMSKCTVIADVGRRAFVGANSVVTRPIPAYSLAVGAPARVVDRYGPDEPPPEEAAGADPS